MEQSNLYPENNEKDKIIYSGIKVAAKTERESHCKMLHIYKDVHEKVNS